MSGGENTRRQEHTRAPARSGARPLAAPGRRLSVCLLVCLVRFAERWEPVPHKITVDYRYLVVRSLGFVGLFHGRVSLSVFV